MSEDLRYPVGRFVPAASHDAAARSTWLRTLAELPGQLAAASAGLTESQLDTPYREGGWSLRQVVHHLADSHMHAHCRIRIALTEETPTIKPYREALVAELADARVMPVAASLEILAGIHARWVALGESLMAEQWERTMIHPEREGPLSVWRVTALYAWHSRHHLAHITGTRALNGW
jgi:hypothetical protein